MSIYIKLVLIKCVILDFGKDQNQSSSPLPNNRNISFNTTPRPIPKEHLKCNILKGNIQIINISYLKHFKNLKIVLLNLKYLSIFDYIFIGSILTEN